MSKYEYGFEEWSQDTRRYTLKCDRKLTRDEVNDAVYEIVGEIHDDGWDEAHDKFDTCQFQNPNDWEVYLKVKQRSN